MAEARSTRAGPVAEGHYTVTSLENRLQLAHDWFAVRAAGDGLVVESRHTLYGVNFPAQEARFEVGRDWTPRRFEVRAEGLFSAHVEFGEAETVMTTREGGVTRELRATADRRRLLFFLSGGFYFPLHAVRRFRFDDPRPQQFVIFPDGLAEIRRVEDVAEGGRALRRLEMKLVFGGVEDVLTLGVNEHDDLVHYRTRNQNILVKLEEQAF